MLYFVTMHKNKSKQKQIIKELPSCSILALRVSFIALLDPVNGNALL